jgi:hypothetical protein
MCTIGTVFQNNGVYVYKQCDLTITKQFYDPVEKQQKLRYLAMPREGRPGLWAGLNENGVCFVAADAYTNRTYETPDDAVNALFNSYEDAVGNGGTAREAAKILEDFYLNGYQKTLFPGPDIALFADSKQAIFIEFTPGSNNHNPIREVTVNNNYFASTNHFRIQPDAVVYESNHSTYLRLARSETILEKNPDHSGIIAVLTDQYYGPSELSICRIAQYSGEYFTQATAVFGSFPDTLSLEYQINGNPINNPLRSVDSVEWFKKRR